MAVTNRRHDLIAVDLHDPLEKTMGNVGLLALEDPETGEIVWADTGSKAWRAAFQQRIGRPAHEYNPGLSPSRRRSDRRGHQSGLRSALDRVLPRALSADQTLRRRIETDLLVN